MDTSFSSRKNGIALKYGLVILLFAQPAVFAGDLDQLIPGLYGGNGITLATEGPPQIAGHQAHFTAAAGNALDQLNNQLSRNFAAFPFNSSAGSFAFSFDRDLNTLVNTSDTLGPIFAERAATLGKGKWNVSFYGTFFNYDSFNGNNIHGLHVIAQHRADLPAPFDPDTPTGDPIPGLRTDFELDTLDIKVNVDASVRIFSPTVTYGVTDKLDVTALLPIVSVDMDVQSHYSLVISPLNTHPTVHDTNVTHGATPPDSHTHGSATGIGDLLLEAKYRFLENGPVDVAGAFLAQFATGDANNFLGTGDTMLRPFIVASHTFRNLFGSPLNLTPHVNLGYQFDVNYGDLSALEYVGGFDLGIRQVSLAWELLGAHYQGGPDRVDTAVGLRWNFWKTLVASANVILPLNNQGVRSDVITTLGIGATF